MGAGAGVGVGFGELTAAAASDATFGSSSVVGRADGAVLALPVPCHRDLWQKFRTAEGDKRQQERRVERGRTREHGRTGARRECCRLMEFNRIDEHQLIMPQTQMTTHIARAVRA